MDETGIQRLEAALRAAVAAHRTALRAEREEEAGGLALRFLLARLGFAPAELDAVAAARKASDFSPALRSDIRRRLALEAARLLRLARARSPAYDLNRHIAVHRASRWANGTLPPDAPAAGDVASGAHLNRRFRSPPRGRAPSHRNARRNAPSHP